MKFLLNICRFYIPPYIKKKGLKELFACTAKGFGCDAPEINGLSYDESLLKYAQFTKDKAENAIQLGDDLKKINTDLYERAFQLGTKYRRKFHIKTANEVMKICRLFYYIIGIDFQGTPQGEITIKRCFFSNFYSEKVCSVISSLDEGLIAGLSGGGELTFAEKITEGKNNCKAQFAFMKN